jgi:hypothetical protein
MSQQPSSPPPKLRLPEGLNAAQMAQVNRMVMAVAQEMKLRQWCIEKALEVAPNDPVPLATQIYNFVVPALPESETN